MGIRWISKIKLLSHWVYSACGALAICLVSHPAFCGDIDGIIVRVGSQLYLQNPLGEPGQKLNRIVSSSESVQNSLKYLDTGDFLSGNGLLDMTNAEAKITSIDYVGLNELLGRWIGIKGLVEFKTYTDLVVFQKTDSSDQLDPDLLQLSKYKYSVSPIDGKTWNVFFTGTDTTFLAELKLSGQNMTLTIFDSDDGTVKNVLHLTKQQ